jgi:malonyl-CoA O-methyltransferase
MRVAKEFSRFATTYQQQNIIQKKVAKELILSLKSKNYNRILDIGCGSGEVYKNLEEQNIYFHNFTAIDMAEGMLDLHPKSSNITLLEGDFSKEDTFKKLQFKDYNITISSSAIQWSPNLDITLQNISKISKEINFAIFTSKTFASLHKCADIKSPIYSEEYLKSKIDKYFNAEYKSVDYKLYFDTVYEMLKYIKLSGVNGGESKLSFKQTKKLMREYPLEYLEFNVIFVVGVSKLNL